MTKHKYLKKSPGAQHFRLFLLLILFQPTANVHGQNTFIKGGINVSSVAGLPEQSSLIGYHLGIGGMKGVSGNLSLKYELIFSQQGTKVTKDYRLVYYYLNTPVLLNARFGENFS